jgi:hypothetical protein
MKPTDEQKALFTLCVTQYANILNLRDWRIEVSDKPASKGAMADVTISAEDRMAVIRIGKDWGPKPITDLMLRETALHEVLHIFLRPLIDAAISRDQSAIDGIEHSTIVLLEKLLAE